MNDFDEKNGMENPESQNAVSDNGAGSDLSGWQSYSAQDEASSEPSGQSGGQEAAPPYGGAEQAPTSAQNSGSWPNTGANYGQNQAGWANAGNGYGQNQGYSGNGYGQNQTGQTPGNNDNQGRGSWQGNGNYYGQNPGGWQNSSGYGQGYQQNPAGWQKPPQTPPRQNTEYQWNAEDYDKISPEPAEVKTKSSVGLRIFAIVMTVVFLVTASALAGVVVYFRYNSQDPGNNTLSSGGPSQPSHSDGPQMALTDRPAPDNENYTDGVLSTEEIAAKVRPSVVGIVTYRAEYPMQIYATGSGIIMSADGYIVTNAHVVSGATGGIVVVLDNEEEYQATLVGSDERTDVAVIKIQADNLPAAEFGNSDQLVVGERIVAIGNPTGMNLAGSVTQGIVSGLKRNIQVTDETTGTAIEMEAIQVDAAINPGNSGGALINKYGQVVGINSSKLSSTQIEGIGFAIPISTAKPLVDDLIAYGYVRGRVLLGITYSAISDVVGAINGYTPGLLIRSVRSDMDIAAKGVRAGDIIVQMDDQDVRDSDTVKAIMAEKKPGDTIKLQIVRTSVTGKSSTFTVEVELAEDTGSSQQQGSQQIPGDENQGGLQILP